MSVKEFVVFVVSIVFVASVAFVASVVSLVLE